MHLLTVLAFLAVSVVSTATAQAGVPQEFVITAYYSPLPDQCCYVRGSYDADRALNGNGTHGADGTPVYVGMAAAPKSLPFGTRIELPGIGTVSVHDRGGAIVDMEKNIRRLDLWVGAGEEGLARALAFGVQEVTGTVYLPGDVQPPESFSLATLPAPLEKLKRYVVASDVPLLLTLSVAMGDKGYGVELLQRALQEVGYFSHAVTGLFGPVTQDGLRNFLHDYGLDGDGASLTEKAAALLLAAAKQGPLRDMPIVHRGSSRAKIASLQRSLRSLGFYRGRTDGVYDDRITQAILSFQLHEQVVKSDKEAGAGRLGPKTRRTLALAMRARKIEKASEQLLAIRRLDELVAQSHGVQTFLGRGSTGEDVRKLQTQLARLGHFDAGAINGVFGEQTEKAVTAYQLASGIIDGAQERGAGYVGPATLVALRRDTRSHLYRLVRAEGWDAL